MRSSEGMVEGDCAAVAMVRTRARVMASGILPGIEIKPVNECAVELYVCRLDDGCGCR